jgi:proteasome lid subunit RPN8/RPN11
MTQSDSKQEWASWRVEDPPFAIQYSRAAMETVRSAAMEGLHKLAKGGLEVGGLLIGERSGDSVRILDSRPIVCEHAYGPSFVLSAGDEELLRRQLAALAAASEATGLAVVGWYHSHTRSQICLTEKDQEIYDRHFPGAWQVSLVLRPDKLRPVRAGFFYRELGQTLRRDSSYREFELEPLLKTLKPAALPATREPSLAAADVELQPPDARRPNSRYWLLFALAWSIAAASLAFALRDYWLPRPPAPAVTEPIQRPPDPAVLELTRQRDELALEVERLRADLDRLTKDSRTPRGVKAAPRKGSK